jgi:DNA-binding transcriptional LysR family regulator
MPAIIKNYLEQYPDRNITMLVDNTKTLLEKLEEGIIDFALIEGYFDKEKYGYHCFQKAEFIGVCSGDDSIAEMEVTFDELFSRRLIIRELGSGTRDILETILHEMNYNINSFPLRIEVGNFNVIKELVLNKLGITFVYQAVVQKEIKEGKLQKINLRDFHVIREFNIVYLKDDVMLEQYSEFLGFMYP